MPAGLSFRTNGVEVGKTPAFLREIRPGLVYCVAVTDGQNDLIADVSVGPKETITKDFAFHYGAVQLSSVPSGATVTRNGKEVGKTPIRINHVPTGAAALELKLQGYKSTNVPIQSVENQTINVSVKLMNLRFANAMKQAQYDLDNGNFADAQKFISDAQEAEPGSQEAIMLSRTVEFKVHCERASTFASDHSFDKAQVELDEADKLTPNSADVILLRDKVTAAKTERFYSLIRSVEDSLSRNALDDATNQLDMAIRLFPDNPNIASLRKRMGPALRTKNWHDFIRTFPETPFNSVVILNYQKNLTEVRDGTIRSVKRVLCVWKLQKETKPNDQTVCIVLAPAGLLSGIAYRRTAAIMLSQIEDGLVEMRVEFLEYPYPSSDPAIARDGLKINGDNLFVNLESSLGRPIILNSADYK